jgi:multidrug efflux system membrane fusion protein
MSQRILTPPQPDVDQPPQAPEREKDRSHRRWLWVLVLVLLAAGAIYWYHRASAGKEASSATGARASAVTPVVATTAQRGDIGVYFTGLGAVTPIYTVTVKSRVDGQLMSVPFKEGQLVHKGDLLAQIDPRPFQVQLTQAQGQLIKDQAALDNARIDLTRYQTLLTQNAAPEQQYATQKALIAQDEGVVKTDEGQIASAKLNIVYCHITSPITGRVGLRLVDPGNIVHATDTNGLVVITQVQPISVIFTIAEDQVPAVLKKVRAGQRLPVEAYDREMKSKLSQGTLTTLDNQIDPTTGTLKLRATFDNKDDALFPDQFVNARLLVEQKRGVTLLPAAAIQRSSRTTFVYQVKPHQTVTVRPVVLGANEGDKTEIVSGVSPGDIVVTTGVDKLQEGSKVKATVSDQRNPGKNS